LQLACSRYKDQAGLPDSLHANRGKISLHGRDLILKYIGFEFDHWSRGVTIYN